MVDNSILTDSLKLQILHSIPILQQNPVISSIFPHKNLQEQSPQKEPISESTALEFPHQKKNI